jgi:hypothetical protein
MPLEVKVADVLLSEQFKNRAITVPGDDNREIQVILKGCRPSSILSDISKVDRNIKSSKKIKNGPILTSQEKTREENSNSVEIEKVISRRFPKINFLNPS